VKKGFFILLFIVLLSTLTFSSCGINNEQNINETVSSFYNAYQNRSFSQCLSYFSQRLINSQGETSLINNLQSSRLFAVNVSLQSMGKPSINGTNATIWVDVQKGLLNITNSTQIFLIKEGSSWKIDRLP